MSFICNFSTIRVYKTNIMIKYKTLFLWNNNCYATMQVKGYNCETFDCEINSIVLNFDILWIIIWWIMMNISLFIFFNLSDFNTVYWNQFESPSNIYEWMEQFKSDWIIIGDEQQSRWPLKVCSICSIQARIDTLIWDNIVSELKW